MLNICWFWRRNERPVNELCADLPKEFVGYMNYVHYLREEDQPDYRRLRKMFNKLFRPQEFEYDKVFDWIIREYLRLEPKVQEPLAGAAKVA